MKLLPLGTVVRRKENKLPLMIIGYYPYDEEENLWQYIGVNIILGTGLKEEKLAFNEDGIEEVLFTGYRDQKGEEYRKELAEAMEAALLGRKNKEDKEEEMEK